MTHQGTTDASLSHYELASIPLVELNHEKRPIGYASGCLLKYKDRLFLLTVAHATGNQGNWAIQLAYEGSKGTKLHQLGGMNFIKQFNFTKKSKPRDIDFSYKLLPEPLLPLHQILNDNGDILVEHPKDILTSDLSCPPNRTSTYGFAGLTRSALEGPWLWQRPKVETGLRYIATEGDYHVFETAQRYKSYKEYQGCSGAPILSEEGQIVSLVVEGDKHKTKIHGLNLAFYRLALDAEILTQGANLTAAHINRNDQSGDHPR